MKEKIKIAFQGEKGAYSHLACLEMFPDTEPASCSTFEEAFQLAKDDSIISLSIVKNVNANGKISKKDLKNGKTKSDKGSEILAMQKFILSITENGYGKRTSFYDYRVTNRGGKGIIGIINSPRNGNVASSLPVDEGDEILISTDKGRVIRCAVKEIRTAGRNTQGVRIFKLSGEEKVVSAIKIDENFYE